MSVEQTEYQKEYAKAYADLEEGKEVAPKVEEAKSTADEPKAADPVENKAEPAAEEAPDELAQLKARVEKAEKMARDNQAWATKMAQERAQERKEREAQQREASKPAILDNNPELADAIRFVANDPAPRQQQEQRQDQKAALIDKAHPGIFDDGVDPELQTAIAEQWKAIGGAEADPLEVIRVITEQKLAHAERQIGKRFAAESAKEKAKAAMSVPGAGSNPAKSSVDAQLEEVQRIQKMSDADFLKEVRRVKGY